MDVHFEQTRVPSVFGRDHRNALVVTNTFPQGAGGKIRMQVPEAWKTSQRDMNFKLALDEKRALPFYVRLDLKASTGKQPVRLDFDVSADRHYRFSVYRNVEVGLGDVVMEFKTKIDERGMLVVEQRMTNNLDKMVDFKCLLYAPNRRRQSNQVYRLGRGHDIKRYYYPNGAELKGQQLWLRAEELGGQRILNYSIDVPE